MVMAQWEKRDVISMWFLGSEKWLFFVVDFCSLCKIGTRNSRVWNARSLREFLCESKPNFRVFSDSFKFRGLIPRLRISHRGIWLALRTQSTYEKQTCIAFVTLPRWRILLNKEFVYRDSLRNLTRLIREHSVHPRIQRETSDTVE